MTTLVRSKIQAKTSITYKIVKSICKTHGSDGETVYGVEAKLLGDYNDYTVIEDVSANRYEVEKLIFRLKKGQVTPNQLNYIVEDYLEELNSSISYFI